MSEYDSILKEEKKYEDPEPLIKLEKPKHFPWLLVELLVLILLLIISYIVYYNTILSPHKIFLNNLKTLTDKYQKISAPIFLTDFKQDKYNLKGMMFLDEHKYYFEVNKNKQKTNLNLNFNGNYLYYYSTPEHEYLKIPDYEDKYYQITNNNYLTMPSNINNYLKNILTKDDFIKKIYLNDKNPIVETDLVLNNKDIKKALNLLELKDNYELLCTFKNNAITNKIISMKITINNKTTNERGVILYENETLTYKDDKYNLRFDLEEKNRDFLLRIYKDNNLYSVLEGKNNESNYQYTYQIIDKIYNIKLKITKKSNLYTYQIVSTIETNNIINTSNMNIKFKYKSTPVNELIKTNNSKKYKELTEEEKDNYQEKLNNIIGELRKFIDKHKQSIY